MNGKQLCRHHVRFALAMVLIGISSGWCGNVHAQQTVFNVPTTDVLDQGRVYVELDTAFKPTDSTAVKRFSSFVPRLVAGAGHGIEVGLNVVGNTQPGPDSTTLVPTLKWKIYDGVDNGWAMVAGNNVFLPLRHKTYDVGNYAYWMIQKTFHRSTRLGFGSYFFSRGVVAAHAMRAGGQFTIEQPLSKTFTVAADWFTGAHAAGYFTPGVIFKMGPRITGYASYSIGNQAALRGNNFAVVEVGYNVK